MTSKRKREQRMRGDAIELDQMFSYISAAQRVPQDHPLRSGGWWTRSLGELSPSFEKLHWHTGRPSIPPESRRLVQAAPSSGSSGSVTTDLHGNQFKEQGIRLL
jgi:hypothetical protein